MGGRRIVRGCAREIILARDLLHQAEARCRVPVRLPVPQGTGELSSVDHSWVGPRDRNCAQTVNPATHVQNGFIHFRCHESTQIHEYNQGLLPSSMPPTERTNEEKNVDCGSAYRNYTSSFSPNDPGAYPLPQICRYPHHCRQFWRQLWRQSVVTISPEWVRHLLYPIYHYPDVSTPIILCGPGG